MMTQRQAHINVRHCHLPRRSPLSPPGDQSSRGLLHWRAVRHGIPNRKPPIPLLPKFSGRRITPYAYSQRKTTLSSLQVFQNFGPTSTRVTAAPSRQPTAESLAKLLWHTSSGSGALMLRRRRSSSTRSHKAALSRTIGRSRVRTGKLAYAEKITY
jgi:hypothetical protein